MVTGPLGLVVLGVALLVVCRRARLMRRLLRLFVFGVVAVVVFGLGASLGAAARWRALGSPPVPELLAPRDSEPERRPGPITRPGPGPRPTRGAGSGPPPVPPGAGPCASTYAVQAVYVVPADAPDRGLHHGTIQTSIGAFQEWLAGQTGGRRLRMVCDGGVPAVAFLRLAATRSDVLNSDAEEIIEGELEAAGFDAATRIYAAYYDGPLSRYCGVAETPGHVAIYTLWEGSSCDFELGMAHEIFHALGAVPLCAFHRDHDAHVIDDPRDIMYVRDRRQQPAVLDAGRDDYFGHGRPGCLDLADSIFLDPASSGALPPPGWPAPRN